MVAPLSIRLPTTTPFDFQAGKPDYAPKASKKRNKAMAVGPTQLASILKVSNQIDRSSPREGSRVVLKRYDLIFWTNSKGNHNVSAPTHSALTPLGRETVCCILGQYADSLVAHRTFLERMASPSIMAGLDRELALARIMAAD
jgi:hypothetical protein